MSVRKLQLRVTIYFVLGLTFMGLFHPMKLDARIQSYRFDKFTVENGLSSNAITGIVEDSMGFLWIGTETGLCRFDGNTFVPFRYNSENPMSLSNNSITTLLIDQAGVLWVGTLDGLNEYDYRTQLFKRFYSDPTNSNSLPGNSITALCEDQSGNLWVGTRNGLAKFNRATESFILFRSVSRDSKTLSDNVIRSLCADNEGNVWVGTNVGLNKIRVSTQTITRYFYSKQDPHSVSNNVITSLYLDKQRNLWVGTNGFGINRYLTKRDCFERHYIAIVSKNIDYYTPVNSILQCYEDHAGTFWLATEDGLVTFDRVRKVFDVIRNNPGDIHSLSGNQVQGMWEDRSFNLWVGTQNTGLNKLMLMKKFVKVFQHNKGNPSSISSNYAQGLLIDKLSTIWIGTWLSGMNWYNSADETFLHYTDIPERTDDLSSSIVYTIYEDRNDKLWIGTAWGINLMNRVTGKFDHWSVIDRDSSSLSGTNVYAFAEDTARNFWAATNNGLNLFDRKTKHSRHIFSESGKPNSLCDNFLRAMIVDSKGTLWLGSDSKGLDRYTYESSHPMQGHFTHYIHNPSLQTSISNNNIFCIYESSAGKICVGTLDGLNILDPVTGIVQRFGENDGLPGNTVYGILEDGKHNLWISTSGGLTQFNSTTNVFTNYHSGDGLPSNQFNRYSYAKGPGGEMCFGTSEGVVMFHPDSIRTDSMSAHVVFTSFFKFNKKIHLVQDIMYTQQLSLSYDENVLTFEFAALHVSEPGEVQYSYVLEGFDHEWTLSGNRRTVTYTHLDPGEYRMRVKASNSDGVWNSNEAIMLISVIPPYWATLWFRSLLVLLFLSSGPIIYFSRVSSLKKEKHRQQEMSHLLIQNVESERKRIASDLHDGIAQNILMIKNRVALVLESKETQGSIRNQLQEISDTASLSLDEIRSISYNLRPAHLERFGLTDTLQATLSHIASTISFTFEYHVDNIDNMLKKGDEIHFFRIIQEGVNNIIKHAHPTRVNVIIMRMAHEVYISLKDNGKGFDVSILKNLSTGLGLRGMQERIRILDGTLTLKSSNEGTHIIISIPMKERPHGT